MKRFVRRSLILFAVAATLAPTMGHCGEVRSVAADELGKTVVITGALGQPVGEIITIEGESELNEFSGYRFVVSSVNGKKLKVLVDLHIDGLEQWPTKKKIVTKGYEYGTLRFRSIEDTNLPPNANFPPRQHLFLRFQPTVVVSPEGLKQPQLIK